MSPFEADSNRLQALFQAGHYVELEALAQTFLARQPQAGEIWYLLGQTYLAQGRLQAARQALERASMLLSDQAPVWTDRKFNRMRPSMARVLGLETRSAKEG